MNRRRFVQAAGAWVAGGVAPVVAESGPDVKFPTDPRARLAVASWPFRKLVDPAKGTLPLMDFARMVADRYGVMGIEPLGQHFPATDSAYLEKLRAAVEKAGSRVVNVPVDRLGGSCYDPDAQVRARVVATCKKWADVAQSLGSPAIRTHITRAPSGPDVALAADTLRQVADYAAGRQVVVHLENDDRVSEEAFFLVDVLVKSNHPYLRALPDFCNSALLDRPPDYNYKALAALFQHAYGIAHAKDSEQDGKRLVKVDAARVFAIAKSSGFRGYFSMEYDADGDPDPPTRALIEASLKALA